MFLKEYLVFYALISKNNNKFLFIMLIFYNNMYKTLYLIWPAINNCYKLQWELKFPVIIILTLKIFHKGKECLIFKIAPESSEKKKSSIDIYTLKQNTQYIGKSFYNNSILKMHISISISSIYWPEYIPVSRLKLLFD